MDGLDLVIFDCDGVLIDSEWLATRLNVAHYARHGFVTDEAAFTARFAGMTGAAILAAIEGELGRALPAGLLDAMEAELDTVLAREVEPIEGIAAALEAIAVPVCVCSNSGAARLAVTLARTGLAGRFGPDVFSALDLVPPAPKPAPDVFRHAMARFDARPSRTVVVEDSVHGIAGAVAAGARVIGFTGGRHTHPRHGAQLMAAGAMRVIAAHRDLPGALEALAARSEAAA